jgi:hypothetical protein
VPSEKTRISLDSLEGEKCKWCAKDFEARQFDQMFCSRQRQCNYANETRRRALAEQRKTLTCADCGASIEGAGNTQATLCAACRRVHRLATLKAYRKRAKAETAGRRGTTSFPAGDTSVTI